MTDLHLLCDRQPTLWQPNMRTDCVGQIAARWSLSITDNLQGAAVVSAVAIFACINLCLQHPLPVTNVCASAGSQYVHRANSVSTFSQSSMQYNTHQQQGPDISQLSPLLQRQWDHAKNAHLGSILVKVHSRHKVWWSCDQCPMGFVHSWVTTVTHRSYGSSCPYCCNKAVCQHNSLATHAPAVAAQFSSRNKRTAHDYTFGTSQHVIWQCEHGHEWSAAVNSRTSHKTGCPECSALRRALQPRKRHPVLTNSQQPVMQRRDWNLNAKAGLDPSKITCSSRKRANWICHCCSKGQPHRWQAIVENVFRGTGCPCCAGRQPCKCNSLQSLFPKIAAEWDYIRNKGTPDDYTAFSAIKVWWYSDKRGHSLSAISSRTCAFANSKRRANQCA